MSAAAAVVFDLDGTLVDSAPDMHAAMNAVLAGRDARVLVMIGDDLADVTAFQRLHELADRGLAVVAALTGCGVDGAPLPPPPRQAPAHPVAGAAGTAGAEAPGPHLKISGEAIVGVTTTR